MEIKPLVTFIIGTRPEAIKLAPVIKFFQDSKKLKVRVLLSGQHSEMVYQVMDLFNLNHDKNLNLMKDNQSINYITQEVLQGMKLEFLRNKPKLVFVQGDTTTAFAASLPFKLDLLIACLILRAVIIPLPIGFRDFVDKLDNEINVALHMKSK